MCDFPNVENNDIELELLCDFCDDWDRRIEFLADLMREGHADESLILCCCYIEAIGKWLCKSELSDRETFAKALIRYGRNKVFSRVNPVRLISELQEIASVGDDSDGLKQVAAKLSHAFAALQDRFYPEEEIRSICNPVLEERGYLLLERSLWMGSLAALAHGITGCEGIHDGEVRIGGVEETVMDCRLFYPALKYIFESARRLIMSGKLRTW
jgi:hypothetical protein